MKDFSSLTPRFLGAPLGYPTNYIWKSLALFRCWKTLNKKWEFTFKLSNKI